MPPSGPDSGDDYEPGKAAITPVETKKRPAVGSKKNSMKIVTKAAPYAPQGSSKQSSMSIQPPSKMSKHKTEVP
jgi:hypothetical protein